MKPLYKKKAEAIFFVGGGSAEAFTRPPQFTTSVDDGKSFGW